MSLIISTMHQGLIFALIATGVFFTSRVARRDDLSVEGSFGLGGAATAALLALGVNPLFTLGIVACLGALVGFSTGFMFTRLKMNHLMAGLVSTTACFSLALYIGSANKIVADQATVFELFGDGIITQSIVLVVISCGMLFLARCFLATETGLLMKAAGENPQLLTRLHKSGCFYQVLSFMFANALTALSGFLFVQWSGFFSITGNVGMLITGLATLMIAELFSKKFSLFFTILAAFLYQSIFSVTLMVGLPPEWNNLVKAIIIVALVVITNTVRKTGKAHA